MGNKKRLPSELAKRKNYANWAHRFIGYARTVKVYSP